MKEKEKVAINEPIWKKYTVEVVFRDKILGGIPKNKELLETWCDTKGIPKEAQDRIADEAGAEETAEKSWTGFKSDTTGVYIEERQVKAMLKETATTMRLTSRPGFRDQVNHGAFVKPEKIYLKTDIDQHIVEPHGQEERPIHVMGPRGPRSALTRQDYVNKPTIKFELWVVNASDKNGEVLPEKLLKQMLTLGQELGLGASRSQGYGKFDITLFQAQQ